MDYYSFTLANLFYGSSRVLSLIILLKKNESAKTPRTMHQPAVCQRLAAKIYRLATTLPKNRLFLEVQEAVPLRRSPGAVPGDQIPLKVLIAKGEVMTATVFRFSRPENAEA